MILDSSAVVSVYLAEPGYEQILKVMEEAEILAIGAPTLVETAMVLTGRLRRAAKPVLLEFIREYDIEVVAFRDEHWIAAFLAFARFGKGRHPAALNFGDCLAYAVASIAAMPLLFTGEDFRKTDLIAIPE